MSYMPKKIEGASVDELVLKGVKHIINNGERISSRAGGAIQDYGVIYVLSDLLNRVHSLRNGAMRYFARELIAYFSGSLKVEDGLAKASKFWASLADENGNINSNYGYYVFHEKIDKYTNQYNWAKCVLLKNKDTRRAIININQVRHKSDTKDFPCTVSIQFYIKDNELYCETNSRSTDIITGLPYDMGFFSFVHELMWKDLIENGLEDLKLGPTIMKTTFTQIYDKTINKAYEILNNECNDLNVINMPSVISAQDTLNDIMSGSSKTDVVKWIYKYAE